MWKDGLQQGNFIAVMETPTLLRFLTMSGWNFRENGMEEFSLDIGSMRFTPIIMHMTMRVDLTF